MKSKPHILKNLIDNIVGNNSQSKIKEIIKNSKKNLDGNNKNLDGDLNINKEYLNIDLGNLKRIDLSNNEIESIRIEGLENLESLVCSFNKLKKIELINCKKLKEISCSHNCLKKIIISEKSIKEDGIIISGQNMKKLEHLDISDNSFESNLDFLNGFTNLVYLYLENWDEEERIDNLGKKIYNNFFGSLEPLSKMKVLKELNVSKTYINSGIEYLPEKLENLYVSSGEKKKFKTLEKQLDDEFKNEYEYNVEKKYWKKLNLKKMKMISNIPIELIKYKIFDFDEDYSMENLKIRYEKVYPELPWTISKNNLISVLKTPLKLYNLEKNDIEKTKGNFEIDNYAIVSYVWGDKNIKNRLSDGGIKTLEKAKKACNLLGINYLWIDQECIDYQNKEETSSELSKLRDYYKNSSLTLISIQKKVGKDLINGLRRDYERKGNGFFVSMDVLNLIVGSQWFSRALTYQEGWLSRKTIFMFDDYLVDGSFMSMVWSISQPKEIIGNIKIDEIFKGVVKIATPLGRTYYKGEYDEKDKVSLILSESLYEIKKRKWKLNQDGLYSILSLLPYGNKVKIDYDLELEEILINIMKEALQDNWGELISWYGEGSEKYGKSWVPIIYENGKTSVIGGIKVRLINDEIKKEIFTNEGIKISGSTFLIDEEFRNKEPRRSGDGFIIDNGFYTKNIRLKSGSKIIKIGGNYKTLKEKINKNDFLIIPSKKDWKSKKNFAILASKEIRNIYRRKDLVEIIIGIEELEKDIEENIEEILIGGCSSNRFNLNEEITMF